MHWVFVKVQGGDILLIAWLLYGFTKELMFMQRNLGLTILQQSQFPGMCCVCD